MSPITNITRKVVPLFLIKGMLLSLLLILNFSISFAKNYYVSSSLGNDNYTTAQAQNSATPWKSLVKVNAIFSSLLPGDSILFKSGDVFYGSLVANSSGSVSKRIVIASYGNGSKPLLSGFLLPRGWTDNGNGIWETQLPIVKNNLNLVSINNQPQALGRYPNIDAGNGGYLNCETVNGTTSFTDNQLTSAINWTGADVVMRKVRWILDICKITAHSGGTISYTNPVTVNTYPGRENFGYFIQNDPRTLDNFGEWFLNKSTRKLQVYFGDDAPANHIVQIGLVDSVINLGSNSHITVDNIAVEGGNVYGIYAKNGNDVTIKNCIVQNCGDFAIYIWNIPNTKVEYNQINNVLNNGIYVNNETVVPTNVTNNYAKNIALIPGMGESGDNTYNGIFINGNQLLIEYNRVDSTGYNAIEFQGNDVMVAHNFVTEFCTVKDDGGGIYTYANNVTNSSEPNRVIKSNIILNTTGNAKGAIYGTDRLTPQDARGIYMDGGTTSINVIDNSIANCVGSGMYYSCAQDIYTRGNTTFNTIAGIMMSRFPNQQLVRNLTIQKNIFFPLSKTQNNLFYWNGSLNEPVPSNIVTDIRAIGTLDSNYYRDDVSIPFEYYYHLTSGGTFVDPPPLNLSGWKSLMSQDANSKLIPKIATYKINSINSANKISNGLFAANISGLNFWSSNTNYNTSWDNTSKITGTGSLKITSASATDAFTTFHASIGAVSASKKYVLRFKTVGTTVNAVVKAYIRKTGSPYNNLVPTQLKYFGTSITNQEFLFTAPTTEADASFLIEIQQFGGTIYIDDLEFFEVTADDLSVESQVRFEYNETKVNKTIALPAIYKDVEGTTYNGSITLAPFTSKILIKDTGSVVAPLVANISATSIKCFGGSSTISVSATGGYSPYTGTGTFSVNAGTYNYTVKDAIGTTKIVSITIAQPASPLQAAATAGTISIAGGTTTVSVSALGGTAPYVGTGTFTVTAGTYSYTITDANNCTSLATIIVAQPTVLVATASANAIACFGGNTNVTVSATGGLAPYTGVGSFNVIAGTYTYTVRDANNATATTNITVTQPGSALIAAATAGTINVNGGSTSVTVTATGGRAPYTGTGTFTVTAGTYTYSITDANGCTKATTITITQPLNSTQFIAAATNGDISCYGSNKVVTVTATGGTAPYTGTGNFTINTGKGSLKLSVNTTSINEYVFNYWDIGTISANKNYVLQFSTIGAVANSTLKVVLRKTLAPFTDLTTSQTAVYGTNRVDHQFVFRNPTSDAAASFLIQIAQQAGDTYIDNIGFFEATTTGQLLSKNLYSNGDFENNIDNLYVWSANNNQTATWDNTGKISANHFFTVNDAVGAVSTVVVKSSQPQSALQVSATAQNILVNGGTTTVTVSATGGVAPYSGTGTFTVSAGTYTYTVTDANNCTATKTISITQPSGLQVVTKFGNISCFNGSASVSFVVSGGLAPYTGNAPAVYNAGKGALKIDVTNTVSNNYVLNYSNIGEVSSTKSYTLRFTTTSTISNGLIRAAVRQTNTPFSNLTAYQTKNYGTAKTLHEFTFVAPTSQASASFLIELAQITGTTYIDNIAFFESTNLGVLIGSNRYQAGIFESGIADIYTYTNNGNHATSWDTTRQMGNIYYYNITDANGAGFTAVVEAVQPNAPLSVEVVAGTIGSFGGSTNIQVSALGGYTPYAGTGTFSVTAGTYIYVVTDAGGCQVTKTITVTQPSNLQAIATTQGIKCFGGSAVVNVVASGGIAPFYGQGNYSISSGKGCYKVQVINTVPNAHVLNYWTIGAVSSNKNYVLRFSTIGTNTNSILRVALRQTLAPFSNITQYQTNTYGLDRVDHQFLFTAPPNSSAASFIIEIPEIAGITYLDNLVFYEATASANLIGNSIYVGGDFEAGINNMFSFSNNNNHIATWDTTFKIAKTYYFNITDNSGAVATAIVNATQPLSPLVATSVAPAITVNGGTTTVKVTASGGTAPYTGTGNFVVTAGKYTYTVTDANGCTASTTYKTTQSSIKPLQLNGKPSLVINKELQIEAYPNPSNNAFNIKMQGGTNAAIQIVIVAFDGRVVYNKVAAINQTISVGNEFRAGLYTVKAIQGDTIKVLKLIKL